MGENSWAFEGNIQLLVVRRRLVVYMLESDASSINVLRRQTLL